MLLRIMLIVNRLMLFVYSKYVFLPVINGYTQEYKSILKICIDSGISISYYICSTE
jgi:hypothetical protein